MKIFLNFIAIICILFDLRFYHFDDICMQKRKYSSYKIPNSDSSFIAENKTNNVVIQQIRQYQ